MWLEMLKREMDFTNGSKRSTIAVIWAPAKGDAGVHGSVASLDYWNPFGCQQISVLASKDCDTSTHDAEESNLVGLFF